MFPMVVFILCSRIGNVNEFPFVFIS